MKRVGKGPGRTCRDPTPGPATVRRPLLAGTRAAVRAGDRSSARAGPGGPDDAGETPPRRAELERPIARPTPTGPRLPCPDVRSTAPPALSARSKSAETRRSACSRRPAASHPDGALKKPRPPATRTPRKRSLRRSGQRLRPPALAARLAGGPLPRHARRRRGQRQSVGPWRSTVGRCPSGPVPPHWAAETPRAMLSPSSGPRATAGRRPPGPAPRPPRTLFGVRPKPPERFPGTRPGTTRPVSLNRTGPRVRLGDDQRPSHRAWHRRSRARRSSPRVPRRWATDSQGPPTRSRRARRTRPCAGGGSGPTVDRDHPPGAPDANDAREVQRLMRDLGRRDVADPAGRVAHEAPASTVVAHREREPAARQDAVHRQHELALDAGSGPLVDDEGERRAPIGPTGEPRPDIAAEPPMIGPADPPAARQVSRLDPPVGRASAAPVAVAHVHDRVPAPVDRIPPDDRAGQHTVRQTPASGVDEVRNLLVGEDEPRARRTCRSREARALVPDEARTARARAKGPARDRCDVREDHPARGNTMRREVMAEPAAAGLPRAPAGRIRHPGPRRSQSCGTCHRR